MSTFKSPAPPSSGVDLKTLNGALLLVTFHQIKDQVPTTFGPTDAASVDIAVLDGPNKGDEHQNTLLFPRLLVGQLQNETPGAQILARLGQGVAKPGQSAPWKFEDATAADQQVAHNYLAYKAKQVEAPEDPF